MQLLDQRRAGMEVEPVPYPEPDILCALPSPAVKRAYPDARIDGWQVMIDDWTSRDSRPGFKTDALKRMGINATPDELADRVLLYTQPGDQHGSRFAHNEPARPMAIADAEDDHAGHPARRC